MKDFAQAVLHLIETAKSGAQGKKLQKAVTDVVDAFDAEDVAGARSAVKQLSAAIDGQRDHAAQILSLALGALVEQGAPADAAWQVVSREIEAVLQGATRFAVTCIETAKTHMLDTALEKVGDKVAKKLPNEAAAWLSLPSRCMAAVACVTNSAKVRRAAALTDLLDLALPLEEAVDAVGLLTLALQVADKGEVLVVHPRLQRGYRLKTSQIATNAELFLFATDAVVGNVKDGGLPGKKFARSALTGYTTGKTPAKPAKLVAPFDFLAWTALTGEGSIATDEDLEEHSLSLDDAPTTIPDHDGIPVLVLADTKSGAELPPEPLFPGLLPSAAIAKQLSPAAVKKLLAELAAHADLHRNDPEHAH